MNGSDTPTIIAIGGGLFAVITALIGVIWGQLGARIRNLESTAKDQDAVDRRQAAAIATLEAKVDAHEQTLDRAIETISNQLREVSVKIDRILFGRTSPPPAGRYGLGSGSDK